MITSITQTPASKPAKPYPKLMVSMDNGTVVLFASAPVGTVVGSIHPVTVDTVGGYADNWDSTMFADFDGSITLENQA